MPSTNKRAVHKVQQFHTSILPPCGGRAGAPLRNSYPTLPSLMLYMKDRTFLLILFVPLLLLLQKLCDRAFMPSTNRRAVHRVQQFHTSILPPCGGRAGAPLRNPYPTLSPLMLYMKDRTFLLILTLPLLILLQKLCDRAFMPSTNRRAVHRV